jgi:hypothetical protein
MKKIIALLLLNLLPFLSPQPVSAHAFGTLYTLPIPYWMYAYAGTGVLLVSFLIIGFFIKEHKTPKSFPTRDISKNRLIASLTSRPAQKLYKAVSLILFGLTILSGLIGEDISAYNVNMTFFWVIFVLGLTYLTFVLGNIWSVINPWKIITEMIEGIRRKEITGTLTYPAAWHYYPSFVLYVLFIIIELFMGTTPFTLSLLLLEYTVITLAAIFLFGKKDWLTYGEFFSVFFRFISYCSPVAVAGRKVLLRIPFTGLIDKRAKYFSVLLFILFMLSSTASDGFRETNTWQQFVWNSIYTPLSGFIGDGGYQLTSIIALILSPFFFLALYLLVMLIMKYWVKSKLSVTDLALSFAFSLVPIAFVYNAAHYFTLLLIQGQEMVRLISDPFGYGWNLFGTAGFSPNVGIISASSVWHVQVVLILIGHVVSVYVAHLIALTVFPDHKVALRSQLPMLILMIIYTAIGLWILSQPLSIG